MSTNEVLISRYSWYNQQRTTDLEKLYRRYREGTSNRQPFGDTHRHIYQILKGRNDVEDFRILCWLITDAERFEDDEA